jgi:hypothetical protein
LLDYALNPLNERRQHKARVFERALGFNLTNWSLLKQAILAALLNHPANMRDETVFGRKYEVVMLLAGVDERTADVMTVWQFDRLPDGTQNAAPRLVTLYVL